MNNVKELIACIKDKGLENVARRFYSSYYAIVVNSDDPNQQGRVRLRVPAITGQQELPTWVMPKAAFATDNAGFFRVPKQGEGVYVEFLQGDPRFPIYSGGWWAKPTDGETEIPEEASGGNYGNVTILKTEEGQKLVFNDADGSVRLEGLSSDFVELSGNLVKIQGASEFAVLGGPNNQTHNDIASQIDALIAQLNTLTAAQSTMFATWAAAVPALAAGLTAYSAALVPIQAQLAAIQAQLASIQAGLPNNLSTKVKLD